MRTVVIILLTDTNATEDLQIIKKKNKVTGVYTKIVCKETLKNAATSSK